jgi:hypothetical protein
LIEACEELLQSKIWLNLASASAPSAKPRSRKAGQRQKARPKMSLPPERSTAVAQHPETCLVVEQFLSRFCRVPVKESCDRAEAPRCAFRLEQKGI